MPQFPTPPDSPRESVPLDGEPKISHGAESSIELLESLDTLLERYLDLLDRHQKLQADLAKRLSSGFLSLAQANYTCPPARRYGADYYDERMKAIRRISLQPALQSDFMANSSSESENTQPEHSRPTFIIEPTVNQCKHENEDSEDGPKRSDADSAQEGQPGIEGDGSDTSRNGDAASESEGSPEKKPTGPRELRSKGQSRLLDPITWYGILVPPSLRSAQKFFTDAVESQVPELASVVVEMQVVEQEVYRVRQELAGE